MEKLIEQGKFKELFEFIINLQRLTIYDYNICKSGIYFLFKDDIITYIGISQNINERIFGSRGHYLEKDFDSFSYIEINKCNRDLEKIEYSLISFFHPKDNCINRGFLFYEYLPIDYKLKIENQKRNSAYKNAELFIKYFTDYKI